MMSLLTLVFIVAALLYFSLAVLNEYERAVVFRLGRVRGAQGPGLIFLIPVIDRMVRIDLRVVTLDIPAQDIITRDNISLKVNAVVYFRVTDPVSAVTEIENYLLATSKLAQTTLRTIVGQIELDELLAARESVNRKLATILDEQSSPWGVKVTNVEVKQIDLPVEMQRAMAKQAEAERERRAKVIAADAELQASQKLSEAARVMETSPMTMQLRYLQTIQAMAGQNNTTTIVPLPIELLRAFSR